MPDPTIAQRLDRIDAIRRTLLHELRGLTDHLADLDRPYAAATVIEDSQYVRAVSLESGAQSSDHHPRKDHHDHH